jgi:acetyl esterase/lipase
MDWLLALLALFDVVSMYCVFTPRTARLDSAPWARFAFAVHTTELAWMRLALQVPLALLLVICGALGSALGVIALLIVMASWLGVLWCLRQALDSGRVVEEALQAGLGADYRQAIAPRFAAGLRGAPVFADWRHPFRMVRPGVEVIRGIPYAPGGIRQRLDIYRPAVIPPQGCPVLFQIHGGAWVIGHKEQQALPLMWLLASKGWICVSVNYRLSPSVGFPTHLEDCKRALAWVRTHGREYGMDTAFVAVTGGSAGGHLALMGLTGNRPELQREDAGVDTSVQACVPFYGVYDFLTRYEQHPNGEVIRGFLEDRVMHATPEQDPALWDLASPVQQIHGDAPPFMVVHGTLDSLASIADGRTFVQRLRRTSRNPVVFVELPGAEHGFDFMHSPRTEHAIDGVHRFLEWVRSRHVAASGGESAA